MPANSAKTVNMSIRINPDVKNQADYILNQLGMTMNGAINMFLEQIVREKAVPLNLTLSPEQALYADLLYARTERAKGNVGCTGRELLAEMDAILEAAEAEGRGEE